MTAQEISRRGFIKVALGAAGGAVLASCTPAPAAPTTAPTTAATEAPAAAGFSGSLEYWDWAHPAMRDHGKELIASYTSAHPEVKINQTTLEWGDYQTKAMSAASAKSGPDLSATHQIWKWDMIRGEALVPSGRLYRQSQEISTISTAP
jgi:multiple sugar transport system substrate-binding protein